MCFYCKSEALKPTKTNYVVDLDSCIIIVKNVPCEECEQCGEKYFSDEIVEKLDAIVDEAKKLVSEITVVDFAKKIA
ncbi:MAG: type II toxin-antitoxin system MqsA family antitoxin [Bacillota bacterium]|nr:type II toxin-antitoxin system MqsA family antitoxin [Bacillota bacterium]